MSDKPDQTNISDADAMMAKANAVIGRLENEKITTSEACFIGRKFLQELKNTMTVMEGILAKLQEFNRDVKTPFDGVRIKDVIDPAHKRIIVDVMKAIGNDLTFEILTTLIIHQSITVEKFAERYTLSIDEVEQKFHELNKAMLIENYLQGDRGSVVSTFKISNFGKRIFRGIVHAVLLPESVPLYDLVP